MKESKELETTYIELFFEETKVVFQDPSFQKQALMVSKSLPQLSFILKDLEKFNRLDTESLGPAL